MLCFNLTLWHLLLAIALQKLGCQACCAGFMLCKLVQPVAIAWLIGSGLKPVCYGPSTPLAAAGCAVLTSYVLTVFRSLL